MDDDPVSDGVPCVTMDGVPVVTQSLTLELLGPGGWVHPPSCLL